MALIFLGAALRMNGLFANTFHVDEALFASWARLIAVWRDPLLQTVAVDKPPLLFYVQAIFYPLLGTPAEWPARLPNLIAGILIVPLTAQLAHSLYRDRLVTLFATAVVSLSPLAIQFSATAFTDPLLTFWLLLALVMVVQNPARPSDGMRYAWLSGLFFGLAAATKYQAWLFLPLLLGLGWHAGMRRSGWARWLASCSVIVLTLLLWELARTGTLSLVASQWESYGGVRLAWSWELAARLTDWARLWLALFGSPLLTALFFLFLPLSFLLSIWQEKKQDTINDQLLVLFTMGYMALHWLLAVPVWDRYLLPMAPLAAILLARLVRRIQSLFRPTPRQALALVSLLALLMIPAAGQARVGAWPVGGRPEADQGAADAAAFLQDAPYGTVLYDHWYSWHWRYHLFDRGVYVSWFPHGDALVEDLEAFAGGEGERFLVLPKNDVAQPVLRAIEAAGFSVDRVFAAKEMVLYQIQRRRP